MIPVPVLASLDLEAPGADDDARPPDPRPAHVGIVEATWAPARDIDPRAVRITGAVRRHPPGAPEEDDEQDRFVETTTASLALRVDGQKIARAELTLAGDRPTPFEFTHTLADREGPRQATLELETDPADRDPLPGDDRAFLWLSASERLQVVVVNGDPSELRTHDETFFLATALASADSGRATEVHSLAPEQFEERVRARGALALSDVDVLILANVRAPAEDVAPVVVRAVGRGLGLWITAGERVQAREYNERLGELLPLALRETVVAGTAPGRAEARTEGLAPADLTHPALRGLSGDLGLTGARTRRMILLEPDPAREVAVALAFTNGAPALLTAARGRGRVAVLTTSIDRDWTDMPLRPGFVPLVERLVAYLGSARRGSASTRLWAGEPWVIAASAPVTVHTPDGDPRLVAPDQDGLATFTDTLQVGHYRVTRPEGGDDAGGTRQAPVCSVNVDPVESQTRPTFDPPREPSVDALRTPASVPRWRPLVWLAAVLLLLETLLRWRRRP